MFVSAWDDDTPDDEFADTIKSNPADSMFDDADEDDLDDDDLGDCDDADEDKPWIRRSDSDYDPGEVEDEFLDDLDEEF